jgi:hypothetical protein
MNHYNLISKLKLYPKQSFPGGVDNDPDTVYNNPGSISIPASRDQETVGDQLPSRSPSSDTPLGDTGDKRIPTTEAPLKSPNDPIVLTKDQYISTLQKNIRDNSYGTKNISASSPNPLPDPTQLSLVREYNSKGIYFKTNLTAVNKRDEAGNIIVSIGETNVSE